MGIYPVGNISLIYFRFTTRKYFTLSLFIEIIDNGIKTYWLAGVPIRPPHTRNAINSDFKKLHWTWTELVKNFTRSSIKRWFILFPVYPNIPYVMELYRTAGHKFLYRIFDLSTNLSIYTKWHIIDVSPEIIFEYVFSTALATTQ